MKGFIIAVALLALFISGSQGLEMTASIPKASIAMDYGAGTKDIVSQHINANPKGGEIKNSWYFTGPGSTSRYVYGYYGGYAKSGFNVSGIHAQTWYDFSTSNYPYASVSESLTSRYAKEIYAFGYASSNRGDVAKGYIDVYSPANNAYLNNYWNNAYATYSSAQVQQKASYASANSAYGKITTYLYAKNYYDVSRVYAKQYNRPTLSSYPYTWTATAYANRNAGVTDAYQGFKGYGNPIYINEYAKKYGWTAITRGENYFGTHALGQYAYTRPSAEGIQHPHWV